MNTAKLSTDALLDTLGLQPRPSVVARVLTASALVAGGVVVGAALAFFFLPRTRKTIQAGRPNDFVEKHHPMTGDGETTTSSGLSDVVG
ncbi:MAG: hypothetical protein Q8O67_16345 [Deltaproteobacteria bacterium]|nr:hypothetical protein [Deltaproteobacteria bacterium]